MNIVCHCCKKELDFLGHSLSYHDHKVIKLRTLAKCNKINDISKKLVNFMLTHYSLELCHPDGIPYHKELLLPWTCKPQDLIISIPIYRLNTLFILFSCHHLKKYDIPNGVTPIKQWWWWWWRWIFINNMLPLNCFYFSSLTSVDSTTDTNHQIFHRYTRQHFNYSGLKKMILDQYLFLDSLRGAKF